jgi:hypothetical protein
MVRTVLWLTNFIILVHSGTRILFGQEVVINEFLTSNATVLADPDFGSYADWIELYNPADDTAHLDGYFLTDDSGDLLEWQFPGGIAVPPGGFLVIWADGRDTAALALHTSFRLSMDGEEIFLTDTALQTVDSIIYDIQEEDISSGRKPDGGPGWYSFRYPTPGGPNSGSAFLKMSKPWFSLPAGFYLSSRELVITAQDPLAEIRYTTNGNEPDENSSLYSGPLTLASRAGDPNVFSEIRTNQDPYMWLPDWVPPQGEVFKANVIRARTFREGYERSDVTTASYFVDPGMNGRYPTIPVISLVSDSDHLFDRYTGIYVPGYTHRQGDSGTGNYFQDWEKPAHIEFFEPGGIPGFAQDVGISIQGGTSPASPQKGLHVIARDAYGKDRVSYPIFRDDPSKASQLNEFKRFIIRAWGSLITGALFNDAYAHRLMARNDLDIQAYRPVVVFINGEYWGIQSLREANKNSWYYQYHYGIDRDDPGFDILIHHWLNGYPHAFVDEGDANHWNAMMNFINTHNMNDPENYAYLKTRMDMANFITYIGHCIYVGKWDWPNNNDASWRPRTADGKWRWIQFDMETGFGVAAGLGPEYSGLGPSINMFEAAINGLNIPNFGTYGPHPILARIYNNEEFREDFIDWFVERFDHEFHPDTMNRILDEMAAEIRPYMSEYKQRWPFIGEERGSWEASLEVIRDFNNRRQDYVKDQLLQLYNTDKITPVRTRLLQNYPNPFTGSTTIRYQLPQGGDAVIRVFNSLGQQVAEFRGRHDTGGQYNIEFDAWNRAAGMYYYSLESEGFFDVKKMLLLR